MPNEFLKLCRMMRSLARNESTTATKKKLASDIMDIDDESVDYDSVNDLSRCF